MSNELMTEFLERLAASGLLENARIEAILQRPETLQGDVEAIGQFIVASGWLTPFQLAEIRDGRGSRLRFNGYQLVECLIESISGTVYKATHPALLEPVAFKWLNREWLEPRDRLSDYLQRAQSVSLVTHPHLLNVLDAGQADATLFIVSEHIEATDLGLLVQEMGALPVPLACEYARQAALGLQSIHELGLCHGDFSPARMLIWPIVRKGGNGKPNTLRPGPGAIVKVAEAGQIPLRPALFEMSFEQTPLLGSIEFAAPERLKRSAYHPRGDVYSLGASLYYLLAARPPFQATEPAALLWDLDQSEPAPIATLRNDLPPKLAELIQAMLSKDPDRRPADAGAVAAALLPFCDAALSPAKPNAIPIAYGTLTAAKVSTHPEEALSLAEILPGVEPLPDHISDSQVFTPRQRMPEAPAESSFAHHDPFGVSDDSTPRPARRRKQAESDGGKSMLLLVLAIGLHLAALGLVLWYLEVWPFSKEKAPAPEIKQEEPRPRRPKAKQTTTAIEPRFVPPIS